jgi:pimeloyl-ACP methyl ester carboxylesterase
MVTYDLRGHGNSDKPLEPEKYKESRGWADEVQAVIDAAGLKRPVLVGWSYGGRVIADYLSVHGAAKLAGLNYVDAVSKSDPSFFGDGLKVLPQMASDDLATNIAATRTFLRGCFEKQPTQDEFEAMLAFNMMVPPKVRANMGGRTHGRHAQGVEAARAGDAGRGRSARASGGREIHRRHHSRRQALALRGHRPRAVLGGHRALQRRARGLRTRGQQDELRLI